MGGIKLVPLVDFFLKLAHARNVLGPWDNITSVCFKSHLPFTQQTYTDDGLVVLKAAEMPTLLQLCVIVHKLPKLFNHNLGGSFFFFFPIFAIP